MSRTFRNRHFHPGALRNPKTQNEIKQIQFILTDIQDEEYNLSGMNHLHHRLASIPTAWDDLVVSAYYESDYDCN